MSPEPEATEVERVMAQMRSLGYEITPWQERIMRAALASDELPAPSVPHAIRSLYALRREADPNNPIVRAALTGKPHKGGRIDGTIVYDEAPTPGSLRYVPKGIASARPVVSPTGPHDRRQLTKSQGERCPHCGKRLTVHTISQAMRHAARDRALVAVRCANNVWHLKDREASK
jgi:DNA-directed RNA polymerase subunit RPC12/RpoP